MFKFLVLSFVSLFASSSFAASANCSALAVEAAQRMDSLGSTYPVVYGDVSVESNPANTSNGVSLIVNLNTRKYLVHLTPAQAGSKAVCRAVNYVIAYPYAELMPQ
jgi:hypothetical protein